MAFGNPIDSGGFARPAGFLPRQAQNTAQAGNTGIAGGLSLPNSTVPGQFDVPGQDATLPGNLAPQQQQMQMQSQQAPLTGQLGMEQALTGGLGGSLQALQQTGQMGSGAIQQGVGQGLGLLAGGQGDLRNSQRQAIQNLTQSSQGFGGFARNQDANTQQRALLGLEGEEAKQAAFGQISQNEFLQDRMRRGLLATSASTGQVGGSNLQRQQMAEELGLAQQDFNNRFGQLGQLSQLGFAAVQGQAQSGRDKAGVIGDSAARRAALSGQGAGIAAQGGLSTGSLIGSLGQQGAQNIQGTGQAIGAGRQQTGQNIAQAISGATGNLSNLQQQQGAGLSNIIGGGGTQLANLVTASGQGDQNASQQLAALLANITTSQGVNEANLQTSAGAAEALGITGRASGIRDGATRVAAAFSGNPAAAGGISPTSAATNFANHPL